MVDIEIVQTTIGFENLVRSNNEKYRNIKICS